MGLVSPGNHAESYFAMNSFKHKMLNGVSWSAFEIVSNQVILLGISIVLARLLTPADYGLVGVVLSVTAMTTRILDCGINRGLYQAKELTQTALSSFFFLNLVLSLIGTGIVFSLSTWMAEWYHEPKLCNLMRVMAVNIFLTMMMLVPNALLSRELNFKRLSIIRIMCGLFAGSVAIAIALSGGGAWTLIAQQMISSFLTLILLWSSAKWIPQLCFSWKQLKPLFSFGIKIAFARILESWSQELINLGIGKKYSPVDLGLYSKSRHFAQVPNTSLNTIVGRVFYQGMVCKQNDEAARRALMKKALQLSLFFSMPLLAIIVGGGPALVLFLFGAKWSAMIPFFQIFCFANMVVPFITFNQQTLSALGHSGEYLMNTLIVKAICLVIFFVFIHFSIFYFLWALVFMNIVEAILSGFRASRHCHYTVFQQFYDGIPVMFLSLLTGGAVWGAGHVLAAMPSILQLCVQGMTGGIVWWAAARFCRIWQFKYIVGCLRERIKRPSALVFLNLFSGIEN